MRPARTVGAEAEEPELYYMVVGFEMSPCSIKRQAGQPVEEVACGYENESRFGPQVRAPPTRSGALTVCFRLPPRTPRVAC